MSKHGWFWYWISAAAWAISICAVRPNTRGLDDEMECVREMFDGHSTIQELLAATPPTPKDQQP